MKNRFFLTVCAMFASSACAAAPPPSTLPLETQRDIVSSQIWFTLCKIQSNEYSDVHQEDMEDLIKGKGIDLKLLQDPSVTKEARKKLAQWGCETFVGKSRIGDIVPKGDQRQVYKSL